MASRCGASLGASASTTTSTLPTVQPGARTRATTSASSAIDARAAVALVARGEQRPEVGQAGGPEQGVGDRVRDRVGVGVAGEARCPSMRTPPSTSGRAASAEKGCTS